MSDVAAHLVDEMLPKVPVRLWVCSLPWRLRYAMGYDRRRWRSRARRSSPAPMARPAQFEAVG
jgi:hypothetical protein